MSCITNHMASILTASVHSPNDNFTQQGFYKGFFWSSFIQPSLVFTENIGNVQFKHFMLSTNIVHVGTVLATLKAHSLNNTAW